MRRNLAAIFTWLPACALAQFSDLDRQLIDNPKAHLELPRQVTGMDCLDTGSGDFICYKDVGGTILSIEAPTIGPASLPAFVKALRQSCRRGADLGKAACQATVSFHGQSVDVDRLRLEARGPLVRRVAFKAATIEIRTARP